MEVTDAVNAAQEYADEIKKCTAEIEATLGKLDDEHDFARQKITEHFNKLALELDNRKKELLDDLAKLKEYKARRLGEQKTELAAALDTLHEAVMHVNHAVQDNHPEDAQHFVQQLEKVPRQQTPIPLVETTKFQYTLDSKGDVERLKEFGFLDFKPHVTGITFAHQSDFDTNGVLYWMGCNYGTKAYQNPADLGLVTVAASSCEYGQVNHAVAHDCAGGKHNTFMTQSAPGSWLTVYLGVQYVVCPTAYTLKNCVINPCHALANWEFQGSNNGTAWDTLKCHADDKMLLPARGSVHTWAIEGCTTFYNRFRILMTGPNQHTQPHAKFHYLMLSGMEIYGFVEKTPWMEPNPK